MSAQKNGLKTKNMRKIVTILLIIVLAVGSGMPAEATQKKVNSAAVTGLVNEYHMEEGFTTVSVGSFGVGMIKALARMSAQTEEERQAIALMDKLNKVLVIEYNDASQEVRESFGRKVNALFDGAEKIIEIKEDGSTVNIYGTFADDGDSIDDLIMFIPEDCTMICLFGSISAQKVADLMAAANE